MPDLTRVEAAIDELETACARVEAALRVHDHAAVEAAIADQRRLTHELQIAAPDLSGDDRAALVARLRGVYAFREDQLRRLGAYRDALAKRLSTVSAWNSYAKGQGVGQTPPPSLLDSAR